ncbi:chromosome segregation protein SMC [Virgibacillus profundi]|uniref:Chromosome partition protein Smc n=1 Tax=Virgibacillus profundi TaxID=2024555 RepID=A0A2A2IEJ9_9BACI|nr:chromosome segregation protein SMC [Virgibacillus profundi]PAV29972.1 chromosome segregation protein SMC [Virgibacillus profundi]PXY54144.1 chromosome segregation protein SMC [Virgibacillus profundi]
MYLKRLESVGFKSFAERIKVEFVPGVTAVVGPNGSGKSNITDAIRWVLGEQSAKSLRGSKMEDIIFQGSDSRKALNVAEVTLVLDNHDSKLPLDYAEISVTRRVYRSGDSEFYINKQSCRLKDIIDLFMDSGLGREAFSIISQGKVEEILSSKAEERRTIFEEAAGVLKYKQRKKKAEYKLAETQENLNRVEDIIHEIEQQIDPLKEQAETAKKYLKLRDQLKENEISYLISEIETVHKQWQTLLNELEKEKIEEINRKTVIQKKEAALENERENLLKLDTSIETLQSNLLTTTQQLEKYEGKKQLLNEKTKHFAENKQKLESGKQDTAVRIDQLHAELVNEKKHLTDLLALKLKNKQKVEELESKLTTDQENIAGTIEEMKSEYIEYLNEQAAKRNEKQSIDQQLQQISGRKDRQDEKFQDLVVQREGLTYKFNETKSGFLSKQRRYAEKESLIKQLKQKLEQERSQFQESQTKLYQGYQYIEKLKSRKEMLEEMKEDFQGFFFGVKAVLKAREESKLQQIHGAIIELIDVPKEYITAIEMVLGGQAQHIVVTDDQAARNAIAWLKKTNNGRATFLPLSSIQERFIMNNVLAKIDKHAGFVGIASNLVGTKDSFQKAVNHLMGHVVIAKTLKDANEIASLVMRKYRIVTLDGDIVNPGGSMSGGAGKKKNQSLFTRDKDLQEITEKLQDFERRTNAFEQKVDHQKQQISLIEEKLDQEEESLSSWQQSLQELRSSYKELEMKLASVNDNLSIYDQDKQQFNQDSEELKHRDKALTLELKELSQKLASIEKKINILTNQETEFKENQDQLQQELHTNQVSLAELEERVKNQQGKTNTIKLQLTELQEQYDSYTSDLEDLITFNRSKETEEDIDHFIETKRIGKSELMNSIQTKRSERSERTQLLQDRERELKEENKQHQLFIQAIQEKDVKANRLDVELENWLTLLQNDYTITFEKAKQTYKKADNPEETKAIVKQLKQSIEQLGAVNLGAIDEYDRVSERYTFLTVQRNDLVEAKQTLYAVIAEMDEEMQKRFDITFTQIKEEFAVVFKELFGGGHAELKLTDPKNLLDTGVEIIAQPPGKKLQHLGLLSGGERALTAIALLFSILRVRPVPFCVLDEVEAALDEANVVRFAKYVKLYSKHTQFIVITHRKGTMEEADVLYGVTMQESGVSRLVSVRLEETKELIQT